MSAFWSGWIMILSALNIVGCFWLIRWTMKKRAGEAAEGDTTGHSWDGDLEEYNNPLPRWWLWMFYITLFFAVVYLTLYPGMGNWKGVLGWSSHGSQYGSEMAQAAAKYDPIYEKYAAVSVADLATGDEYQEARDMGKRLYLTYCMQCHGSDAGGAQGYPNLTDAVWNWGGAPEQIKLSIANGRKGMMPPHPQLDDATVKTLVSYLTGDAAAAEAGQAAFMSSGCVACHGIDGKGNPILGAPNLMDEDWLFGGGPSAITETILKGRNGEMPAHQELLGDNKVHLLTAYVYSLSK